MVGYLGGLVSTCSDPGRWFPDRMVRHGPFQMVTPRSLQVVCLTVRSTPYIWWRIRVGERVSLLVDLFALVVSVVFLEGALLAYFIIVSLPGCPCDFLDLFGDLEELYWLADSQ